MSPVLLVVLALAAVFVLILLHVPIGIAMVVVGVVSFASMSSWTAAFGLMSAEPASMMMSLDIGVIPLFLLMGSFATAGGLSDDIYRLAHALLGHRRGVPSGPVAARDSEWYWRPLKPACTRFFSQSVGSNS